MWGRNVSPSIRNLCGDPNEISMKVDIITLLILPWQFHRPLALLGKGGHLGAPKSTPQVTGGGVLGGPQANKIVHYSIKINLMLIERAKFDVFEPI